MLSRFQHKNLVKKYLVNLRPRCLDTRVTIGFALDIACGMECLHSHGIIHRDLKPGTHLLCYVTCTKHHYSSLSFSATLIVFLNSMFSSFLDNWRCIFYASKVGITK